MVNDNLKWYMPIKRWRMIASVVREMPKIPIAILIIMCVLAIFAPLIAPYPPTVSNLYDKLLPPAWMEGGRLAYPLGTDYMGRDILSRIIYGARVSLSVAVIAIICAGPIGTIIGLVSGYYGGKVDVFLMRLTDITLSIPLILLAIILVVALGPSFGNLILIIILLLWPYYARQVRGETLSIKEQDFVALARVSGHSDLHIMWRHIFPNIVPSLIVLGTLQCALIILLEASLSFLGVGIPPPQPAWGLMVGEGRGYLTTAWWISLWPGLAIVVTVMSVNLLGDWLRDWLDPKLKQI